MGLINEEKVKDFRDKKWSEYPISPNGIKYGSECIEFAENELKNLAIEYSEWLSTKKYYSFCKNKNAWMLYGKSGEFNLTSKQLFDKFIELRNK